MTGSTGWPTSLTGKGYRKGDRVAVLAGNTHKYLEIYFATGKLGMSVTPLNFRLSDSEIAYIVNDSEAVCFLVGDEYEERALGLEGGVARLSGTGSPWIPRSRGPSTTKRCWRGLPAGSRMWTWTRRRWRF